MSDLRELDGAVERVRRAGLPLAVLQCTTAYPCPPERIGLNMIPFFRERYKCFVGLSDHSGTIYPGIAAAAIGVDVVEVHVTMSRGMFGPDVPASVTMEELRAARRRHPLRRADACAPGRQGFRCARHGASARHLHEEPGRKDAARRGNGADRSAPGDEETGHRNSSRPHVRESSDAACDAALPPTSSSGSKISIS